MIEALVSLPGKSLSSSQYNVGTLTTSAVMLGTPVSSLIELLFQPHILLESKQERFVLCAF